ncbi:dihydroneopterin triphosphate diphosphatase [Alteromonas sp. ASW11-130]|uniref:dihydroneopterin triphosphate diphosphatase n=1 Tax=Alteromonas sp. ASW11-130 TaxID=3015775 RepID=UPI002241C241|nr:dihydroneopterin triphosphate diphosphatase [Alteromonas sp. ASW11-130]MCW8091479.1 dihydroneopterin triphosphate diphosphatase [Alteromonas sp. ASW11-130]
MSFKRPESALVVLYDQHYRVLILQREDDPNFWQSVTGTLEHNEKPIQTAYREVWEETGLCLSPSQNAIKDHKLSNQYEIRSRWRYRYPPETKFNTEHVFSAQVDSQAPIVLSEHLAYKWVTKSEAIAKLWSPSNQDAVERFVPKEN